MMFFKLYSCNPLVRARDMHGEVIRGLLESESVGQVCAQFLSKMSKCLSTRRSLKIASDGMAIGGCACSSGVMQSGVGVWSLHVPVL